jgi:hypothetical protein
MADNNKRQKLENKDETDETEENTKSNESGEEEEDPFTDQNDNNTSTTSAPTNSRISRGPDDQGVFFRVLYFNFLKLWFKLYNLLHFLNFCETK